MNINNINFRLLFVACFVLPALAFAQTYTIDQGGLHVTCEGLLYDSGGDSGGYGLNEQNEITFCASGDSCIELTLTFLDLEYSKDFLTIHDGPTTNHPVINNFTGTLSSPQTITGTINSSGCITVAFKSDGAGVKSGFELEINCVECPQSLVATEQDCLGAIPVCQATYNQTQAYSGEGNYPNEINAGISQCSFFSPGEKNGVWYAFTVQSSGTLCFSISPTNPNADYDWALYDLSNASCQDIYTDPSLEVSCNYRSQPGITGANGLSGVQNNPCIPVVQGEKYVMIVSSFNLNQGGYVLDFTASSANIFDNTSPIIDQVDYCSGKVITLHINESILCSSLDVGDFVFTGPGGPYTVTKVSSQFCQQGASFDNTIEVTLDKEPQIGAFQLDLVGTITDYCNNPIAQTSMTVINTMSLDYEAANFCLGDQTVFDNLSQGDIASVEWDFGDGTPIQNSTDATHTYSAEGFYQVVLKLTDNNGCVREESFIVNITAAPTTDFSVSPANSVFLGTSMDFVDLSTGSIIQWLWDFGDGNTDNNQNATYVYPSPGVYDLKLYAYSGLDCYTMANEQIEIKYDLHLAIPEVFSPNSDGINDYLTILAFGIKDFTFKIFNRWGEVVYSTNDMQSSGWDGTYNGQEQGVGVFVYCITGENMATGEAIVRTGNITLIR